MSDCQHKCEVCQDSPHHWMEGEDADGPEFVCKHCDAQGDACPDCGGEGCPSCDDNGVVERDQDHARLEALERAWGMLSMDQKQAALEAADVVWPGTSAVVLAPKEN